MSLAKPHIGRRTRDPSRLSGQGTGLNAHAMVAKVAIEMAYACWEAHMSADNALYRAFRQNLTEKQALTAFVARVAPTLLQDARLALTAALRQPDSEVPRAMKDEIADALIKDQAFTANRQVAERHATIPHSLH